MKTRHLKKALFLDRDGTINIDKGYVFRIEDFEFQPGIFELIHEYVSQGYLIFIITNQSGIARGLYSENDYLQLTEWMKEEFRKIGWNQAQFSDCSAIILICGDRMAYAKDTDRYWAKAPQETREALVGMIRGFYDAHVEARRDENLRSGGMAAQTLMLAAKAMGYDSCPMSGFDFAKAAELVRLPEEHDIIMAVTVGKALEEPRERGGQLPLGEVCFRNGF